MRNQGWLLRAALAALALHACGAAAQDDDDDDDGRRDGRDTLCTGSIGDVQVRGPLSVVARCELDGTDVRGNVTLFEGGSLIARNARIRGRVEGNRADFVALERSRVDGPIELRGFVGDESTFSRNDLRGDLTLAGNRSRLELVNNDLRRSARITGNLGGVLISGNSIDRDLECAGNRPAPTGGANRIDGDADGQCSDLRPQAAEPPPSAPPQPAPNPTPSPAPSPPPAPAPAPAPSPTPSSPPGTPTPPMSPPAPPAPTATPAPTTPAPAAPPAPAGGDPSLEDEGGAGAVDPVWAALLALLVGWRRFARRRLGGAPGEAAG